nr:uncharacterized protein LOC124497886 [Dermatophagoides farinae]
MFELWAEKMIEGRILYSWTGVSIQKTFPTLIRSIPLFSNNLKDYLVRISNSSFLQDKFAMMNPNYIQPKKYSLGDDGSCFYYIPLMEILVKYILNDDLVKIIRQETSENVSQYVRNNGLHGRLRLMIYGDEFGVCRTVRESSDKYKEYVLYIDVDNRVQNSKIKDIHLVLIWRSSDLKNSGRSLEHVTAPLCQDIARLTNDGISYVLDGESIRIPFCVSHILGDNLGVAHLLGFRMSFGRAFICRFCGLQYSGLESLNNNVFPLAIYQSYESYNEDLNRVLSNKRYESPYGIKCRSAFDKIRINCFQIAPPDSIGDISNMNEMMKVIDNLKIFKNYSSEEELWKKAAKSEIASKNVSKNASEDDTEDESD